MPGMCEATTSSRRKGSWFFACLLGLVLAAVACSPVPRDGLGQQWFDALNAHDPESVLKLLAPDATYWESGLTEPLTRESLRGWLQQLWMVWRDRVDAPVRVVTEADSVTIEWHVQQLHPSGRSIPLDGLTVLDVQGGWVHAVSTSDDRSPLMQILAPAQ